MQRVSALGLDLATVTGWGAYEPTLVRPAFGALRLPGKPGELGMPLEYLRQFLDEKHAVYRFTIVFFELQHVSAKMQMHTVQKLISLAGMVEWWCYTNKVRCFGVAISEWRKHFIGRGAGFKKLNLDPKQMALERCDALGWLTDEPDAAEALGVLDYGLSLIDGFERPWRDLDFMQGR